MEQILIHQVEASQHLANLHQDNLLVGTIHKDSITSNNIHSMVQDKESGPENKHLREPEISIREASIREATVGRESGDRILEVVDSTHKVALVKVIIHKVKM